MNTTHRDTPAALWSAELGQPPAGPPLVIGDLLLLPTQEPGPPSHHATLHALNASDGSPRWRRSFEYALVSGLAAVQTSEASETSEVLALVSTTSTDLMRGEGALLALDAAGEERYRWAPGVQRVSGPAVAGNVACVTADARTLVVLGLATGAEQGGVGLEASASLSAPALVGDVAYVPCRGPHLLAVETPPRFGGAGGGWRFDAGDTPNAWLDKTPIVVGEQVFAVLTTGAVLALRAEDGRLTWRVDVGPAGKPLSPPATDGERLFVGARDGLHALDPSAGSGQALADGREVWAFPTPRRITAAPVVAGGMVYAACHDHHLYALDTATGRELWRYQVGRRIEVSPVVATCGEPPIPCVLVADRGGALTAIARPLSAAEHEAAGHWAASASAYAGLSQPARGAELLEAHGEPLKAAELWQAAGERERAAVQYEAAGVWQQAADLWATLGRPLKHAQALEEYARSLEGGPGDDEERATAWDTAAGAFEAQEEMERADACRREVARWLRQPVITLDVQHEGLVLDAWSRLQFIVRNEGYGPARNLVIHASGEQFEGQVTATRQIITLRAGRERTDWLDVRPRAYGDSVPLRVRMEYQDHAGEPHSIDHTIHIPVARSQATRRERTLPMSRKDDLERHIRESYDIIRQYEEIKRTSDRPEEKARARRNIEEQWELVEGYLAQYQTLCQRLGKPLTEDILEIAVTLETSDLAAAPQEPATTAAEVPPSGTARPRAVPPVQPSSPPGPIRNRWALLVGVDRYVDPAFPPLKFCVNDVLALERTLKALGYTVVALHDDTPEERLRPTRDNVEAELARLCQVAGPDDLLLAHFACHGKLVDGQPVLVTRETRAPTLAKKALPLAEVERQMRESQARRLVLTLDACHTGVEIGRDLADPEFIRNAYELAEGFALIAASTAQQVAQEWKEKEHGVFTYYLLEGLSGQADRTGKQFVTVDDLKTHVLDGLRRWNVEHGGLLQEPTARSEGLGDIILADYR